MLLEHLLGSVRAPGNGNRIRAPARTNSTLIGSPGVIHSASGTAATPEGAKKLSAVFRAVDVRSNDMSVFPAYVINTETRAHVPHAILQLLSVRPNEAMTPSVRKKLLEESILLTGNAYDWIIRDPKNKQPMELIPIPGNLVQVFLDETHTPWYQVTDPVAGQTFWLPNEDVCHYKGPTRNGYEGISVLSYAQETVRAGLAAQEYTANFYESGGQPAGVLSVDADLSGDSSRLDAEGKPMSKKDVIRAEWERVHGGPGNSHRIAVLDFGLKYQPLAISQKDSQFVEQQEITVQDIARFFGVPLYKLQSGKQSYNSNEQNSMEYLSDLQPRVTQMEEEQTYKLLSLSDQRAGLEIRYNMRAYLRTNDAARASYYRDMKETGAYSVNDIRTLEDMPDVEGGDEHTASLNYVPLSIWKELSRNRNGGESNASETEGRAHQR